MRSVTFSDLLILSNVPDEATHISLPFLSRVATIQTFRKWQILQNAVTHELGFEYEQFNPV